MTLPPGKESNNLDYVTKEIERIFVRRFRTVKGEEWKLRYLHEIGLRNFVREVLNNHECKKVVQMPTGAGKSVLMSLLALAAVHLREHIREGERRNVMLVFAPLTRIKFQLFEPLIIASGACEDFRPPSFSVYCVSSDSEALEALHEELLRKYMRKVPRRWFSGQTLLALTPSYRLYNVSSVSETLRMIADKVEEVGDLYSHVIVLCPHALGKHKSYVRNVEEVLQKLKDRVLATFIDEAHVMVDLEGRLGILMAQLASHAPIAVGFTATPVLETCEVIAGRPCAHGMLLHGEPIHSYDLMLRKKWIQPGEKPILVDSLVARFYRSNFYVLKAPSRFRDDDLWRNSCRDRVKEYAEKMLEELEKHFGLNRNELLHRVKVLVLAPNTREADMWGEALRGMLHDTGNVFVAHSGVPDPQGEIENFVRSKAGILVTVNMVRLGFDDPDLDALVIARPTKSGVVYVQMRGRVLRYPRSSDRLKLKCGALIFHLAAEEVMEDEDKVKSVERGAFPKAEVKVGLEGFGKGVGEFSAIVEVNPLGECMVGTPALQPVELTPPTEAVSVPQAAEIAPVESAPLTSSIAEQILTPEEKTTPQEIPRKGFFWRILKRVLSALRRLATLGREQ